MVYHVEYTDTFGNEANYSWVRRAALDLPEDVSDRTLMLRAKKAVGLDGARGEWRKGYGGTLEFWPYHSCTVLFVTF